MEFKRGNEVSSDRFPRPRMSGAMCECCRNSSSHRELHGFRAFPPVEHTIIAYEHFRSCTVHISAEDVLLLGGDIGMQADLANAYAGGALHHSYTPGHFAADAWLGRMVVSSNGDTAVWWSPLRAFSQILDKQQDASPLLARGGHAAAALVQPALNGADGTMPQWDTMAVLIFGGRSSSSHSSFDGGSVKRTEDRCDTLLAVPDVEAGTLRVVTMIDHQQCRRHMLASGGPMPRHGASIVALQTTQEDYTEGVLFGGACSDCTAAAAHSAGLHADEFVVRQGETKGLVFADVWVLRLSKGGLQQPGSEHARWTAVRPVRSSGDWPRPIPRSMHSAAALHHDSMLLVGGAQCTPGCTDLGDVWLLEFKKGRWEWALREPLSAAQCLLAQSNPSPPDRSTCDALRGLLDGAVASSKTHHPGARHGAADVGAAAHQAAGDAQLKGFAAQALQDPRVQRKVGCVAQQCRFKALEALGGSAPPPGVRLPGGLPVQSRALSTHQAAMVSHPLAGVRVQLQPEQSHLAGCLAAVKGVAFLSGGESFAPYESFGSGLYLSANTAAASSGSKLRLAGKPSWVSSEGAPAVLLSLGLLAVLVAAGFAVARGKQLPAICLRRKAQKQRE